MKKAPSLSEEVKLLTFALALSSFTFASVIILTFSFIIPTTVINHHNHQCKALLPSLKPHYLLATILFFLFIFKVKTIEGCLLVPSLFLHLLLTFWLIQIWVFTVLTQLSKLFLLKLSMVIDSKHIFFFLLQSFLNSQWHLTPVNYFSFLKLFFSRFSEAPMLFLLAFILLLSCFQTPLF